MQSQSKMTRLYSELVQPARCDLMGHLSTRNYLGMFDEASYLLMSDATDWNPNAEDWNDLGWADVRHILEYRKEVASGTVIDVWGGIFNSAEVSVSTYYEMRNRFTGEVVATLEGKTVLFNLKKRCAEMLSDKMKEKLEAFAIDPPTTMLSRISS